MGNTVNAALAQKLSSPNPFALLTAFDGSKTDVMAISWWTYCSNHPLTVAVCIGTKGYCGDCIEKNGEFALCLPGNKISEPAFKAGCTTGRNLDKVKEFGLEMVKADTVAPEYVKESRLVMECRVVNQLAVGDHRMFIAEVQAMHTDESVRNLMAINGYAALGTVSLD